MIPTHLPDPSVFQWLDQVRARPGMWLRDQADLRELECLVHGYYAALSLRGVEEDVPAMTNHFSSWLHWKTGWPTSRGWAHAIQSHTGDRPVLESFFWLVDEYRDLEPATLCWARLDRRNQPTVRRVVIGTSGRMAKPTRVEVVRYRPTRLHFLRFSYGRRRASDWILQTRTGGLESSVLHAKRWAADELQVTPDQWQTHVRTGAHPGPIRR